MIVLPNVELDVVRPELLEELGRSDYRLQIAVAVCVHLSAQKGYRIVWTSFERTLEQTQDIYRRSGKVVPTKPGVHDIRPCRGGDGIFQPLVGADRTLSEVEIGVHVATTVNELLVYPRGLKTVLYHRVQGLHLHVQVPWDSIDLSPPLGGQPI